MTDNTVSSRLNYDRNDVLAKGVAGFVFRGSFDEDKTPVAVKRVLLANMHKKPAVQKKNEEALSVLDHPNVIKLLHIEQDQSFRYFVLELCSASLDQCFLKDNDPKKYKGSLPSEAQVLYQLANGLNYIHSKKLIHREIKPENVLISAEEPVLVKWSDFGLSKTASAYSRNGPSMTSAGIKGTQYWMAPEVLSLENNQSASGSDADVASGTEASDVFSTGCVFFSYLMNGLHLFGSKNLIVANIMRGKPTNLNKLATDHFAFELIASMTKLDAVKRSSLMETMDKLKPHL